MHSRWKERRRIIYISCYSMEQAVEQIRACLLAPNYVETVCVLDVLGLQFKPSLPFKIGRIFEKRTGLSGMKCSVMIHMSWVQTPVGSKLGRGGRGGGGGG